MTRKALVAAVANLKGGVGKSTTTLMLAEGLAYQYGMNVLIYDFDAQANLSELLLTSQGVGRERSQKRGIASILDTFVPETNRKLSDLDFVVQPTEACCVEELVHRREKALPHGWISLLAADPSMRFLEPHLERGPSESGMEMGDKLIQAIESVTHHERENADLIIIDCPPHISTLCRAALKMADFYVTPTLAETLSIWGLQQFTNWMTHPEQSPWLARSSEEFAARQFVVPTRFIATSRSHQQALKGLKDDWNDRKFSSPIGARVSLNRELPRKDLYSLHPFGSRYRGKLRTDLLNFIDEFVAFARDLEPNITWTKT